MSAADPGPVPGSAPDPSSGADPAQPEMWSRQRVVTGWAQLWNVPNGLTVLRILLIPVFWWLLMYQDGQNAGTRLAATALFMFASYTDWLDGHLARKQGLVTTFGKIADPLADKALTGVALIGLVVLDELPWWVAAVIIAREVGVTVVRFVVLKHGVIPASRGGKAKTLFQMLAIVLFLLPITEDTPILWWLRVVVMVVAVVLTLVTGLDYMGRAYRTRRDSKARRSEAAAGQGPGAGLAQGPPTSAPQAPLGGRPPADGPAPGPAGPPGAG
ncbi:MAG: CDP-diacylglycerol--glycerol-3-phosphate 3-phosphatidyltransferase [Candidatus Nanopelagicales bacterium]|nr:CDP-diacylglycerol--glycerol-3-phosphate 3-phosphatidyltransferase [Candidatus Nanopelagicales bacterium]